MPRPPRHHATRRRRAQDPQGLRPAARTGARTVAAAIPAQRAAEIGLANHVCPDDEVLSRAIECAHKIATLPRRAVEDTKRVINVHLERAVLATIDHALAAEDRSFTSPEVRANLDRLMKR